MNLNKVILIGRLTRDPLNKNLPSGQLVSSFSIATDRFFNDKNGQKQQQTEFHNLVAFGKLADVASQYLKKGSMTFIEGRLQTRNWQDQTGAQKYKTEIIVERLQLGPRPQQRENFSSSSTSNSAPEVATTEEIPVIEENEINIKDIPF